jgi:cell division protein FtsZ
MDEIINFIVEDNEAPIITVIGVGGAGSNAVSNMFRKNIANVNYIVCNTDLKALNNSPVKVKIQLGAKFSDGDGAGNNAENGEAAAIESLDDVLEQIPESTKMVFLTAGMGGGTGTGATPVLAKALRKKGILTVGIVTIPFHFEGGRRINQAAKGIIKLNKHIDSLIIVDNQKIFRLFPDLVFSQAYSKADEVVTDAAKGVAELINLAGYVNVDFEDVRTVLADSGVALMGIGTAAGKERAMTSIKQAIKSPLLENNNIEGAKNILLNIVSAQGQNEITMDEVSDITDYVLGQVGDEAQVLWGVGYDNSLNDRIASTIIATDFDSKDIEDILALPNIDFRTIREEVKIEAIDEEKAEQGEDIEVSIPSDSSAEKKEEDIVSLVSKEMEETIAPEEKDSLNDVIAFDFVDEDTVVEIPEKEIESEDIDFVDNQEEEESEFEESVVAETSAVDVDTILFVEDVAPEEGSNLVDSIDDDISDTSKSDVYEKDITSEAVADIETVTVDEAIVVKEPEFVPSPEIVVPEPVAFAETKATHDNNKEPLVRDELTFIDSASIIADDKIKVVSMISAVMQPNMTDGQIKKIEFTPAYMRHKRLLE